MTIEETNIGQKTALQELRENIEKRKAEASKADFNDVMNVFVEVPTVRTSLDGSIIDLDRYKDLTRRVDALYHNMLVRKQDFIQSSDNLGQVLKELATAMDELISEGIKPRF